MHAAIAVPGNSNTFLTHMLARGLGEGQAERYVGLAVDNAEVLAGGALDHGPGGMPRGRFVPSAFGM